MEMYHLFSFIMLKKWSGLIYFNFFRQQIKKKTPKKLEKKFSKGGPDLEAISRRTETDLNYYITYHDQHK